MSTPEIDEIKQKLDIEQVVSRYVPTLSRSGRNHKGLCPFHNEKTPSFMVNPELGIFKCFGCGEGGDVISFLQKIERLDFSEALQLAAELAGVKLTRSSSKNPAQEAKTKRLLELNQIASQYYHFLLTKHKAGVAALAYAHKRGITDSLISKFELGYAPAGNNLLQFLHRKGYSDAELLEFGLAIERRGGVGDKFRERLMFPIFNLKGDIVGFSGRTLIKDGIPKFLNSPETPLYHKSELLYGLYHGKDAARKNGFIILFEGNVDIINSHRLEITNVACPLGTALTESQLKLAKRYADQVYFCFDTDNAGYKALLRGIELAEQLGATHKVVNLGQYHDADDLMMAEPELWPERVKNAENSISYVINKLLAEYDLATADGKLAFRSQILPVLKLIRDQVELSHFIIRVAKLLEVTDDVLRSQLASTAQTRVVVPLRAQQLTRPEPEPIRLTKRESALLYLLVNYPRLGHSHIDPKVLSSSDAREVLMALQAAPGRDLTLLSSQLSPSAQKILASVVMRDEQEYSEPQAELDKLYRLLYVRYLRERVRELKQRLDSIPDDELAIEEFNQLARELQGLGRK